MVDVVFLGGNMAKYYLNTRDEVIVFDNLYRFDSERNLEWLKSLNKKKCEKYL